MKRRDLLALGAGLGTLNFGGPRQVLASTWQIVGGVRQISSGIRFSADRFIPRPTFLFTSSNGIAIKADGTLYASGNGTFGQLGAGDTSNRTVLEMVSGIPRLLSVASGTSCVIGLTESGEIMGAGLNSSGTLGDNTSLNRSEFITAIGISDVVQIAVGDLSTLALRADGKVFGTGVGLNLGIGMPGAVSTFVSCIGISDAVAIAVGDKCSLVLRADGNVFAAGVNVAGCLGIGSSGLLTRTTFVSATGISLARAVANGGATMLALRADGAVYAVGSNIDGGLGNGTSLNHNTYVQSTGISNAIAIAASPYVNSVYALRSDGLVFACGYNWVGTLGDGTTINRSTYVQVPGLSSIVAISYGAALRSDGALFAVGSNSAGQLGNIPSVGRSSFVQVI